MTGDRLLIIDDERQFGEIIGKVGRSLGYQVEITEQANEFRKHLDLFQPSVLSIDLMMPEIDGIELLRELAARGCKANILVTSGIDVRTLNAARNLGREFGLQITGIIPKPIRVADLRAMLERVKITNPVTRETVQTALRENQLLLAYQPKMDFASGRIVGAEALVRWRTPSGDVLYPDSFIPLAETAGLADALTDWVLTRAIAQAGRWRAAGSDLQLAVNVSARSLHDLTLPDRIAKACRDSGIPPSSLTLELTETSTMHSATPMMDILTRFRLKEIKLSIDDFGTGYSSLVQLQRLPFSEIKIDKSFVMSMHESADSVAIVRAVIDLGHALGLAVVAEGVENDTALRMLATMKCDVAQGYCIARPGDGNDLPKFAAAWTPSHPPPNAA